MSVTSNEQPKQSLTPARPALGKVILRWVVLIGLTALLLLAPRLYRTPLKAGEQVTCPNQAAEGYTPATLEDAVLGHGFDTNPKITLNGTISYSSANDRFYLRDGAFLVPLDVPGCTEMDIYKRGDVLVFIKGTAATVDGRTMVTLDGIHTSAPVWMQNAYNLGLELTIGIAVALVLFLMIGVVKLIRWFLVLIGLKQPAVPKPPIDPEVLNERQAGASLLAGIVGPIFWFLNPFLGILYQGMCLYSGWKGLRSTKRVVAIIGISLCLASFIIMPLVLGALGLFSHASEPNFFLYNLEDFPSS